MNTTALELVDSHAHLDSDAFSSDLDEVLQRARTAGLRHIVAIGSGDGTEGAQATVALAATHPHIWATVGVHPHDADLQVDWFGDPAAPVAADVRRRWEVACETALLRLKTLALHPRVVAIGEVGLDFHYDHSPRELQRELFRRFVRLAIRRDLPLVIHARNAEDEVAAILAEEGADRVGGVIHCFSGHQGILRVALELGFSFGLTGVLTFPKAEALRRVVASLPLQRLLVETDSPYLAPVPHRGRRNEPAYVAEVARHLAAIKGIEPQKVARITTDNARRAFRLEHKEQAKPGRIAYRLKDALYLNITNRCSLACRFCLKRSGHELAGYELGLWTEPSADDVIAAAEEELERQPTPEVVFCGIGEPLLKPEVVRSVGEQLKRRGLRVRVNTDGLANRVHGRDVLAELVGAIDAVSVSLNAHDAATFAKLCPSAYGDQAFASICAFIRRAAELFEQVSASVVRQTEIDLDAARRLAESFGATFRIRG